MREQHLLAGLLTTWYFLYNATPSDSSWIWDWYPDGYEWHQAVKVHGQDAVRNVLTKQNGHTSLKADDDNPAYLIQKAPTNQTAPCHINTAKRQAIFYNVYVAKPKQKIFSTGFGEDQSLIEDLAEQTSEIAKSHVASAQFNTTVYYVTIGQPSVIDSKYISTLCNESSLLTCRHLRHYKYGNEDRTLALLYGYCRRHPSDRVIYIHSKGKKFFC